MLGLLEAEEEEEEEEVFAAASSALLELLITIKPSISCCLGDSGAKTVDWSGSKENPIGLEVEEGFDEAEWLDDALLLGLTRGTEAKFNRDKVA